MSDAADSESGGSDAIVDLFQIVPQSRRFMKSVGYKFLSEVLFNFPLTAKAS